MAGFYKTQDYFILFIVSNTQRAVVQTSMADTPEGIAVLSDRRPCPVECLPNEMFTPLNVLPYLTGAAPISSGRSLFLWGQRLDKKITNSAISVPPW
jgi:hypothetical protein